jgi:retron-type reverse transcriptase
MWTGSWFTRLVGTLAATALEDCVLMRPQDRVAVGLADAVLAGEADIDSMAERMAMALTRKHHWLRPLAKSISCQFGTSISYAHRRELIGFIQRDPGYDEARTTSSKIRIRRYFLASPPMNPRPSALAACALPELPTPGDLAAWLGISVAELAWHADLRGMISEVEGKLCHYHYQWLPKRSGGYRLIASPKVRHCAIQRAILRGILDHVPPHAAAHGFRRSHSCLTYVAPHIGKDVVLRMDLQNFFGSIPAARVNALFKTLGYPEATARYLAGLCTNRISVGEAFKIPGTASDFDLPWHERKNLSLPHLPQGAPTSPALANLCALHLDLRLSALAESLDGNYTRYADDLAISGGEVVRRKVEKIQAHVAAIAAEEKFIVNFHKTRIMHNSDRQMLTGIVINDKTNMQRVEYDRLKAILHNCQRSDPQVQNRESHQDFRTHLLGRVNYLKTLNQQRGDKLMEIFERVAW